MDKREVHLHCLNMLAEKIASLKQEIADAQQAASEDTKSSAGDKFETGREMIKQSINQLNQRLAQDHKLLAVLERINPETEKTEVGPGSLVETSEGWYYFSVSLGKVAWKKSSFFALSMAAPIGKALAGSKANDLVQFMKRDIRILSVR